MAKILIIRLSSLGDVLLTTPVIRCIKKSLPEAEVDFLTKPVYAPLLQGNPHLSQLITLGPAGPAGLVQLRKTVIKKYDYVLDLHKNIRSTLLTAGLKRPKIYRYQKVTFKRNLLVLTKINLLKSTPSVPERYMACAGALGVQDDGKGLDFFGTPEAQARAEDVLKEYGLSSNEAIALAPGARWLTKQWPPEKYIQLVQKLGHKKFVVVGEPADVNIGRQIVAASGGRAMNLAGKIDLACTGEILRRCRALVSNDSGLMHLGCAVNVPTVALFGCTVREFGFFPFRSNARVLEHRVKCRPCSTKGKLYCKVETLECLKGISEQQVVEALESFPG